MEFNFILKNKVISLLKKYLHHQNDEDDDYSVIWLQQVFFIKTKQKHSHIDLFLPSTLFGAHVVLFEL